MHNYGEAFVDRQLVEKVRYAKQAGIKEVGMISNGSLITDEVARGMIEAGLDAINISVDAAGKDVFETTRVGLKYDKVDRRHRAHPRGPRGEAGKRAPEADPVVRAPGQLGRRAGVHRALARAWPTRSTSPTCTTGPARSNQRVRGATIPCYRPWLTFTVLWDGRVSLCCADFDGRDILGDLRTHSIQEIWNTNATAPCAAQHLESGGPVICQSCDLPKKDSPLWVTKLV